MAENRLTPDKGKGYIQRGNTYFQTGNYNLALADFEKAVRNVPQVLACFLLAGESDYLLRIAARDVTDYGRIHSEYLSALPHVLRMESNFALREVVNRGLSAEEI